MMTDEQWLTIFKEQKESGLTQSKYCESKGITLKSFWSRKSRMKSIDKKLVKPDNNYFVRAKRELESKASIQQERISILRIKTKTGIEIEFPISALQSVMEILND